MKLIKIKDLFDFEKGSLQSSKNTEGEYTFITASAEWKTHNSYDYDMEALIFAMAASGSLGRTHYIKGKFISSDLCFVMTPKEKYKKEIDLKFYQNIFTILKSDIVKNTSTGTSKKAINRKKFGSYEVPFFDINHQKDFQIKIDFMLPKSLILEDEYITQKEAISKLKSQLLKEAILGKMTVQNPNDKAIDLVNSIKKQKELLIKEKKIKKEKVVIITDSEKSDFDIPDNWALTRINDISIVGTGATPLTSDPSYYNGEINWITSGNTGENFINKSEKKITQKAVNETNCKVYPIGSLVIALYGQGKTRGQISELRIPSATNQACAVIILENLNTEIKDYIKYFFKYKYLEIRELAKGATQPNLNVGIIKDTIIPIPPLEEQKRIVEKVDSLFEKLEIVEKECEKNIEYSNQLLQSVLKEAFEN